MFFLLSSNSAHSSVSIIPFSKRAVEVIALDSVEGGHDLPTAEAQHKVQCGLLLDEVVIKSATILKLLSGEDQPLLFRRDTFFVLDLGLHIVDGV